MIKKIILVTFAVDGGWSEWQKWSPCSAECDKGIRRRTRSCSRPEQEGNGRECIGEFVQTSPCYVEPCKGKYSFRFQRESNPSRIIFFLIIKLLNTGDTNDFDCDTRFIFLKVLSH